MSIVCVTGMHRSGTSMVGRFINLLGVNVGDENRLIDPNPYNKRGYWENVEVMNVNDAVLEAFGGAWDDPPPLLPGWEHDEILDPIRVEARSLIEQQYSSAGLQGWKDPRASLTLPFWRTVTDVSSTVMCVRSPQEVAASLADRDGIELERSAHMWLRYVTGAWRADPDRLVLRYEELHTQTAHAVRRVAEHIGCPPPDEEILEAAGAFVDPSLSRHVDAEAPAGPMMEVALTMWEVLCRSLDDEALVGALEARRSVRWADRLGRLLRRG